MHAEMISVSLVLFSAGFRHRRHFNRTEAGRSGGKRDENLAAAVTSCYVAMQQQLKGFTDLFLLLLERRFITTLPK
jgi:hypothetical protein